MPLAMARVSAPVAAALLLLLPLPASFIERYYSNGVYPVLQSWLTPFSNLFPFAIGDAFILAPAFGLIYLWWRRIKRAGRGKRVRAALLTGFDTLALVALGYLAFLALWGFNYRREPLTAKLDYSEDRLTADAGRGFARISVERLNSDSKAAREASWPGDEELRRVLIGPFNAVVKELGNRRGVAPGVPKRSVFDFYIGATGTEGIVNPFGLEVILDSTLLPFEKPFTLAHEWAHLAGFADESEANFVALLACARSDVAALRYAGWLALYPYLLPSAPDSLPLAPEAREDLRAIAERVRARTSPQISRLQARVYDGFLRANRVEEGIASYGLFVRLVLGTRFDSDWSPAQKSHP